MLDFVFAVDDVVTWHMTNLLKNRSHYSFLKFFGPKKISTIQGYGAGIYYNTLVPCNGRMIKYGVISTDALIEDLLHWKTLYVAGRLQKPVKILAQNENSRLQAALVSNLKSAVIASFLMLPESFSEEDLFLQIAGLSYSGDFRMIIGEDRFKVQNIVKPNIAHFQKLYSTILQDCPQVVYKHQLGRLQIDKSPEGQFTQLMALPKTLQQKITALVNPPGKNRDVEEILLQVAHDPDCGYLVHQGISAIVRSSSIVQSAKTILTAGLSKSGRAKKSVIYSLKKLYKMAKGELKKPS
ncbi:phosphatidate cytidylyltransferase, mitochondrial isoform X5 [Agelaius tricolor]